MNCKKYTSITCFWYYYVSLYLLLFSNASLFANKNRYLSRVCARLPPLYSEERAQLRLSLYAKSLEDALEGMEAAEGEEMEVA